VQPIKYPITDLIIRGLIRINLIKPSPVFYLRHKIPNILKKIKLRVPGYQTIEILARARK